MKLCFQSQHYKWALLTDQILVKSISLQRRWCSISRKRHELSHLQNIYCHRGNATAEDCEGEERDVHFSIFWCFWFLHCSQPRPQHSSLSLRACWTCNFPAQHCLHYRRNRGTFVWWRFFFFFPRDGDSYSRLDLRKLISHKILQIKSRE